MFKEMMESFDKGLTTLEMFNQIGAKPIKNAKMLIQGTFENEIGNVKIQLNGRRTMVTLKEDEFIAIGSCVCTKDDVINGSYNVQNGIKLATMRAELELIEKQRNKRRQDLDKFIDELYNNDDRDIDMK